MFGLFCVTLVLIFIMGAAVKSQSTIVDTETHTSCSYNEFSDMVRQEDNQLRKLLETERRLVQELRKRVSTLEEKASGWSTADIGVTITLGSLLIIREKE